MANTKISALTALTGANVAANDALPIVDTNVTTTKKIDASELKTYMSNSPTLVTPVLGVATATSINKVALTAPATGSTLTIADGKTLTASNTLTFTGTDTSSVAFGTGGTVAYTANKLNVFAATSSSELAGIISDETGSGALVFGTSPTVTTPTITFSTSATVTAGTNAQGQGALTTDYNVVTTTGSNPSGVTLPTATVGRRIVIVNRGTNPINVYPASGAAIDGLSANAAISVAVNGVMQLNASSTTQWYSVASKAPTVQVLTSGTTYTTPLGVRWIRVRMVGGGGAGGSVTSGAGYFTGNSGTVTSFNSIEAAAGAGGSTNVGGAGGTGGTGTATLRIPGGSGQPGWNGLSTYIGTGGSGAPSFFGGAGGGGTIAASGTSAGANTGSGGGGSGGRTTGAIEPTSGGGAGEYVELIISAPAATYTYAIGSGGTSGGGTTFTGGAGGAGRIIVEEYYTL